MNSWLGANWRRFRRARRLYGVRGVAGLALQGAWRPAPGERQDRFDQLYGTDTARQMRLERLTVHGGNRELAVRYQASEPERVRELLRGLDVDFAQSAFVDVGSGKGRVVLVASTFPFGQVVGIEFSEELDRIAQANLARFPVMERQAQRVRLLCMDAVEFEFPNDALVVYFYNPFLGPVMQSVMTNLQNSLDRCPRRCVVILEGDQSLSPLVVGAGFSVLEPGTFVRT